MTILFLIVELNGALNEYLWNLVIAVMLILLLVILLAIQRHLGMANVYICKITTVKKAKKVAYLSTIRLYEAEPTFSSYTGQLSE